MLNLGDTQAVAELMRETAAAELRPRFRMLAQDEIRQKRPGDFVTVADELSEQRLAAGLARILPGVPVVGEEAVEKDPGLVELIGRPGEACWIVDPLDGTANFAAGRACFAMIVCLVRDTEAIAGWILDVPGDRMAVVRRGEGVTVDGAPVSLPSRQGALIGFVGHRIRKEFDRHLPAPRRRGLGRLSTLSCAGMEYHELLAGRADFSVYRTTKPWDHAAGTLMLRELGGDAVRFDGAPYQPAQAITGGLIAAPRPATLAEARDLVETVRMPLLAGLAKAPPAL